MYKLPDGKYCAYLRKSRGDIETESRGGEDTYTSHERILLELSRRYGINISEVYKEKPVSGERISERPEMIRLLSDVEDRKWTGVLVVEVERLARGDTMDQGIVAQAFKYSETLIVTPMRIFNPNNADDEEYFEFGLFMSRREFKTINRRQQRGREDGVAAGRYLGNIPPYGYIRVKLPGKGFTLEPHPEQAAIVELIFSLYTQSDPDRRMGTARIAAYLNEMHIPTQRNSRWTVATVNGILRNPHYIGNVRWGARALVKRRDSKSRPRKPRDQSIEKEGLHPAIIEEHTFEKAQTIMKEKGHLPAAAGKISNPLAGLVKCDVCGAAIVLRTYRDTGKKTPDSLICSTQYCKNVSSYLYLVEGRVLAGLRNWIATYKTEWLESQPTNQRDDDSAFKFHQEILKSLQKKLADLNEQISNLDDLVEKKVYTFEKYLERSQNLTSRIEITNAEIANAENKLQIEKNRQTAKVEIIPKVEHVLEVYEQSDSPAAKNQLLRDVLEKVTYRKDKGGRWSGAMDQFELVLYPKLPR